MQSIDLLIKSFIMKNNTLKSPEHGMGSNMGKMSTIPKSLNNCVIEHKQLKVPCASFEEKHAQTRTFPIYHSL